LIPVHLSLSLPAPLLSQADKEARKIFKVLKDIDLGHFQLRVSSTSYRYLVSGFNGSVSLFLSISTLCVLERPEKFLPVWCTTQFLVLNGKGSVLRQVGDASRYTNSAEGS
jgi:hypothetical protein